MLFEGQTFKFGDNIDTDVIIPARYLNTSDPRELAEHAMEDADPTFASRVQQGDIIVGGNNFGCGSSREHAPIALKYAGVSCVVAASFARIFYRNAFNIGLPILECPEAAAAVQNGERLRVDAGSGRITSLSSGREFTARPIPPFMQEIVGHGGLIEWVKARLESKQGR